MSPFQGLKVFGICSLRALSWVVVFRPVGDGELVGFFSDLEVFGCDGFRRFGKEIVCCLSRNWRWECRYDGKCAQHCKGREGGDAGVGQWDEDEMDRGDSADGDQKGQWFLCEWVLG